MGPLTRANELAAEFPFPVHLSEHLSLAGQIRFARRFVAARDAVEEAFYAGMDAAIPARRRIRTFLGAMVRPAIGKAVRDPAEFYQTYGRLMRRAWLSLSLGIYTDEIDRIAEPSTRLHAAQVNTVDVAWRPALARVPADGLLVEVGTGRGNSVARIAQLAPGARMVSITISPEQAAIARGVAARLGADRAETRLGDILDGSVSRDLWGRADAVTAIEVTGHLTPEQKGPGIAMLARLLRPGGVLSIVDTTLVRPLHPWLERYFANQSWYFGRRTAYLDALADTEVEPIGYVDHSARMRRTFVDSTIVLRAHRGSLTREFGRLVGTVWPELPRRVYLPTAASIAYVHIVAVR
jgi:SAM-dependent methyltransferase